MTSRLIGSIDWLLTPYAAHSMRALPQQSLKTIPIDKKPMGHEYAEWLRNAYLIFGGHSKLTTNGPFLDLYREFQARLSSADEVVIIGYSFADAHVKHLLSSWMNANQKRTIPGDQRSQLHV